MQNWKSFCIRMIADVNWRACWIRVGPVCQESRPSLSLWMRFLCECPSFFSQSVCWQCYFLLNLCAWRYCLRSSFVTEFQPVGCLQTVQFSSCVTGVQLNRWTKVHSFEYLQEAAWRWLEWTVSSVALHPYSSFKLHQERWKQSHFLERRRKKIVMLLLTLLLATFCMALATAYCSCNLCWPSLRTLALVRDLLRSAGFVTVPLARSIVSGNRGRSNLAL